MSYLVLARKYRPTTFAEVVGQEHVTRTLGNAFATGRVHHAFLFCGPRGCGKTTLARIVGKAVNCLARRGAEPCNECSACTSIIDGSATDYQEMDGASNRGIDSIRELTEAVRYQPAVLKKKVYVIDEVHMLTTEAFNALLKTLEEPPPHVTFVLATTEPHKLPNTILSRCQRYDFKLVPASRLAQHLARIFTAEALAIEPAAVSLIVRESGGSVRDALSLCDQLISYVGAEAITEQNVAEVLGVADRSLTRALVSAIARGDAGAALAQVEAAIERGVDEIQLARAVVRYLRDLSVLQAAPDRPELVDASDEERAALRAEATELDKHRVPQMFDRMLRCCDELGKTLQPRLVLDCALIDVATAEPILPLGDLIERLGELEQRIARGGGGGGVARPASASAGREALRMTANGNPPPAPSTKSTTVASTSTSPSPSTKPTTTTTTSTSTSMSASTAAPKAKPELKTTITEFVAPQPSSPVPMADKTAAGSGPSSLATPTTADAALSAWNEVLSLLENRRKFSLLTYYQPARVLRWTTDELELGFATDVHHMGEMAAETGNVDELRLVLRELGQPVKVAVRLLDARESTTSSARSILEANRESSTAERTRREAEAREHPMTKQVLQTFGASIKEIKTDV
jgi:DNA polymerase-3 subunit gamma/tau|nr:DNA polymerase III subunit gamma/tau [Kofleriaceae bacterium]